MATIDSDIIAKVDASPVSLVEGGERGVLKTVVAVVELTTAQVADTNIVRIARLPSGVSLKSLKIYNDEIDTNASDTLTASVGLYNASSDAVVDVDAYATIGTGAVFHAANTSGIELAFEARDIASANNYLWEDAALSADPNIEYDVCLTFTAAAATAAGGTLMFVVQYMG